MAVLYGMCVEALRGHCQVIFVLFFYASHSATSESDIKPLCPIEHMLRHCLYAHITQRCDVVCGHLLHVMTNDFQLLAYFQAIKVFLCLCFV